MTDSLLPTTIPAANFDVAIPRAPKLPADLADLQTYTPYQAFLLAACNHHAKRERSAYIGALIADTLALG